MLKDHINSNVLHVCERLLLTEQDYIEFLKQKQKGLVEKAGKEYTNKMYFRNSSSSSSQQQGKFYYEYMRSITNNTTEARTTTTLEPIIEGGGLQGGLPPVADDKQGEEEVSDTSLVGLSHTDRWKAHFLRPVFSSILALREPQSVLYYFSKPWRAFVSSFHCNSSSIFSCNVKHFYIVHVFGPCNFVMASQKKRQDDGLCWILWDINPTFGDDNKNIWIYDRSVNIILILNDIDLVY